MECSVELPVENLSLSHKFDYDFIIASTCFDNTEYKDWYVASNRFKILDNGAFETGSSVEGKQYLDLAADIVPDIIVIPDILFDSKGTLDRFFDFMQLWQKRHNILADTELMGVVQPNGSVDTAHMMGTFYHSHGIEWIGVPYASGLDRYQFIKNHPEWLQVHILGCPTLPEAISLDTLPNVLSIDSSLPVKVAKDKKRINDQIYSNSYVDPGDKSVDLHFLEYNLEIFTSTCHNECRIVRK